MINFTSNSENGTNCVCSNMINPNKLKTWTEENCKTQLTIKSEYSIHKSKPIEI